MIRFKKASEEDFPEAMKFIRALWDYNTYEDEPTKKVYDKVINDPESFAFFLLDDDEYVGFCHGDYFQTFWMCGLTCYVSSIITRSDRRNQGFGREMMDHATKLAKDRGCKALILDSGMPRKEAHQFYEHYGFERSCYGFEKAL